MHETLDPIDRLFLERSLREPGPAPSPAPGGRPRRSAFRRLRARVGRQLIRMGSAIAAEPVDVVQGSRRRPSAA